MKQAQNTGGISTRARVAGFLKHELKKNHITQEQFASAIYTTDRNVRRWLRGEGIGCDHIDRFANYFGVSVKDIVTFGDDVLPFMQNLRMSTKEVIMLVFVSKIYYNKS